MAFLMVCQHLVLRNRTVIADAERLAAVASADYQYPVAVCRVTRCPYIA